MVLVVTCDKSTHTVSVCRQCPRGSRSVCDSRVCAASLFDVAVWRPERDARVRGPRAVAAPRRGRPAKIRYVDVLVAHNPKYWDELY